VAKGTVSVRGDSRPPAASSNSVIQVMRGNKPKGTELERAFRGALLAGGIRGFRMNDKSLIGKPDFVFRASLLVVFVDGCYWHGHEIHEFRAIKSNPEFWLAKVAATRERDAKQAAKLSDEGWKVLRFWECEFEDNPTACVTKVAAAVASAQRSP
jgi:DNA mismatch endonuclease Vsr